MPAASAVALIIASLIQAGLGRWAGSGWWIPDLLLVVMVFLMAATSGHRLPLVILGGCVASSLAFRHPLAAGAAYGTVGWLLVFGSRHWDLANPAIQRAAVGIAEAGLIVLWLLMDVGHGGGAAEGLQWASLAAARVAMTVAFAAVCQRFRMAPPWSVSS